MIGGDVIRVPSVLGGHVYVLRASAALWRDKVSLTLYTRDGRQVSDLRGFRKSGKGSHIAVDNIGPAYSLAEEMLITESVFSESGDGADMVRRANARALAWREQNLRG